MLDNCFGIISVKSLSEDYKSLCRPRPAYMLPFGGRYRLVDFMLSNMVNHGISTIAIFTGEKHRSAMDHIGDGQPWELDRRISGLHIFPPQRNDDFSTLNGELNQFHLSEEYFDNVKEENLYFIGKNTLAKIDLSKAYQQFIDDDADITLIYTEVKNDDRHLKNEKIIFDEQGNFINLGKNLGTDDKVNLYLGSFFIKKSIFKELVKISVEQGEVRNLQDAFIKNKDEYKITSFKHDGHVEKIKDLPSYYRASMSLFEPELFEQLFFENGSVYTRVKDEPPTLYSNESKVENSLVANGCVIEGEVSNSIIFRGVKIEKEAVVKDSIVMQKSVIRKGAYVVKSVLDKHTIVDERVTIVGTKSNPYVVEKSTRIRKAD